jgi:predicted DNA-binding transcriptional regulator YafY
MANTSSRTLRLLSLLQAQRYWGGPALADRLGVSARTLRRDVDRLRELGYPVEAHRGVDGGYQLAPGAALPPLVVDDEEAVALAIGLRAAAYGAVIGIEEASVRALAKVVQVMPPRLRRRVEALLAASTAPPVLGGRAAVPVEVLTALAQGCRDEERLRFGYTARGGEESERYVEPYRLVSYGRRWYLVAYDLTRHDWRSFRVDRLRSVAPTGQRFRPRELPGGDAAAFVRAGVAAAPTGPYTVDALVRAPAGPVRERIGEWATVSPAGADACRVRLVADGFDWPAFALALTGADFTVLGPPEMVAHARDWGRRFTRGARGGG